LSPFFLSGFISLFYHSGEERKNPRFFSYGGTELRVKYLVIGSFNSMDGVSKKIFSQIRALEKNGIQAELVLLTREKPKSIPGEISFRAEKTLSAPYRNTLEKVMSLFDIERKLSEEVKASSEGTIVYVRNLIPLPGLISTLKGKRKGKVVFELQGFLDQEAKHRGSLSSVLGLRLFGGQILKHSDGIIGVTEEITRHYCQKSANPSLVCFTNGNGFEVASVPQRVPPIFDGKHLNLLCVAKIAKWHGLDRFTRGISQFSRKEDIRFHIVGDGPEKRELEELVANLNLLEIVHFHGFMKGKYLDPFFDHCHLAIGGLGVHRKKSSQSSSLKNREYCARGIPFIESAEDQDFSGFPFQLRVEADESSINVEKVFAFAEEVLANEKHSKWMRSFALEKIDWSRKIQLLIPFLRQVLKNE